MNQRVAKWLAAAGSFAVLTGCHGKIMPYAAESYAEPQTVFSDRESCRRFLMESVSAADRKGRQEIFVTGKENAIDTLAIAQTFQDVVNISKVELGQRKTTDGIMMDCRIGFEWRGRAPDEKKEPVPETDHERRQENERGSWRTGDVIVRKIAGKNYRFCCIDDDYEDERGTYGKRALFLSQSVIRSDVIRNGQTQELLFFGKNNNYKRSDIRRWLELESETAVPDAESVSTGAVTAFMGKTGDYDFSQTRMDGLQSVKLPFQDCQDRLFLLSLEEAYRYREFLWDMEGMGTMYSRGFWLRTPAYQTDENGNFISGNMEYIADLEHGCFRQADVSDTEIGICPAFCLPQA